MGKAGQRPGDSVPKVFPVETAVAQEAHIAELQERAEVTVSLYVQSGGPSL